MLIRWKLIKVVATRLWMGLYVSPSLYHLVWTKKRRYQVLVGDDIKNQTPLDPVPLQILPFGFDSASLAVITDTALWVGAHTATRRVVAARISCTRSQVFPVPA